MASMAAFVYFWSSAYDVSGCCPTDTLYPSFLRMLATGSQPEPSAKAPCTRTTFLICCVMTILLCGKDPTRTIVIFNLERLNLFGALPAHTEFVRSARKIVRSCPVL